MPADRKAARPKDAGDRHEITLVGARLDPGDDAWIRAHAKRTGQSIRKVVIAAVKHYRSMIENGEDPKP